MKVPKSATILNFLLSKGWTIKKKEKPFHLLAPPNYLKFERANFMYGVPLNEKADDYEEYALRLIRSIADVYEMDMWQLLNQLLEYEAVRTQVAQPV